MLPIQVRKNFVYLSNIKKMKIFTTEGNFFILFTDSEKILKNENKKIM